MLPAYVCQTALPTADAYQLHRSRRTRRAHSRTADALDVENLSALAEAGSQIRTWVKDAPFPAALEQAIADAWRRLGGDANPELALAVRSSAAAEDLPDAPFAGQQETHLNVRGLDGLAAVKDVFASLFNDRAIAYRVHQGFDHKLVALSAGIQRWCAAISVAAVSCSRWIPSQLNDVVFVTAAYGLGETVVQGEVNPDEFYAYKPNVRTGARRSYARTWAPKHAG